MNIITISGKIGTSPTIKTTKNGVDFLNFFFIHNEPDGMGFTNVAIGVNYFGQISSDLKNLNKGTKVLITGKLLSNKVDDKTYYSLKADNILSLDQSNNYQNQNQNYNKKEEVKKPKQKISKFGAELDDIPF